jgi:hypothetical protein
VSFVSRRQFALGGLILAGGSLAGCGGSGKKASTAVPPPGQGASASPSPSPSPTGLSYHPFTGGSTGLTNPVIAIKIDNTHPAHPQAGLKSADIVYIEQVEGGETRIMAIFSSTLPKKVGPVRSARISDVHLLAQYGKPAFAFSGVQTKMKPVIKAASVYDVSDHGVPPYFRDGSRRAPYNLFADPHKLLAKAPNAGAPRDVGFRFGAAPATGGRALASFTARWPAERIGFTWSAKAKKYLVSYSGRADNAAEGGRLSADTVVIQYAKTTRSRFHDFLGSYTPLIQTTGTGKALVMRDGMAYDCTWSRPSEAVGTTFKTAAGEVMNFKPGQTWIALVNDGKPYTP